MHHISKEFDFCYGHRVYTQVLDKELSCNMSCKCRHQHGHQGKVVVNLEALEVDSRGMVIDFNELQWFKKWLDDVLDHKMILSINDPALGTFYPLLKDTVHKKTQYYQDEYLIIRPEHYSNLPNYEQEIYEGLVLVSFVPTSENLSKWLWEVVNKKIGHLCKVRSVQFMETPKTQAIYYENPN